MGGQRKHGPIGFFLRHPAASLAVLGVLTVSATWLHYSIAMQRIQQQSSNNSLADLPAILGTSLAVGVLTAETAIEFCAGAILLLASAAVAIIGRRRRRRVAVPPS